MDFYRRTCFNCGHCIANIFSGKIVSKNVIESCFRK